MLRSCQPVGQISIICQENQPGRIAIKSSDCKYSLRVVYVGDNVILSAQITRACNADRFIKGNIDAIILMRESYDDSVNGYHIAVLHFRAGDCVMTVNGDAPLLDETVSSSAAANAGLRDVTINSHRGRT